MRNALHHLLAEPSFRELAGTYHEAYHMAEPERELEIIITLPEDLLTVGEVVEPQPKPASEPSRLVIDTDDLVA